MTMLISLAALALGATPAQAQTTDQPRPATDPARMAVAAQTAPASPAPPASKPKPKPWLEPEAAKPVAGLPAAKL